MQTTLRQFCLMVATEVMVGVGCLSLECCTGRESVGYEDRLLVLEVKKVGGKN